MSGSVTRRTALRGSVTVSLGLVAGVAAVQAAPTLSANDRQLVAIADELLDIDTQANALDEDAPGYDALIDRYSPLETEMARLSADTLVGLAAKARAPRIPAVAGCVNGVEDSIIDDLCRLQATGRIAHA